MRTQRNYYEIMGLPATATAAEVKRRYRELARKFHPDVTKDKSFGHKAFVQITEAYKVLSDPQARCSYDASLSSARATTPPRSGYTQSQARPSGPRPSGTPTAGRPSDPGRLVREAEFSFIRGRLIEAAGLCRQAIRINGNNARAHAVLGDIYRVQGKRDLAIAEYSYAVQFNPTDRESQSKLEKLLNKGPRRPRTELGRPKRQEVRPPARQAISMINGIGWGMSFFLLFLINISPGTPIPELKVYMPFIASWSWSLVALLALDATVIGFLLSANRILDHPDEELLFQHVPGTMIPIGLPLVIGSLLFFYAAAGLILLLNLLQGAMSKSLAIIFGAVTVVTLLGALMYPANHAQVALFGGNVAFPAAVFGWYLGAVLMPLER
jgi:curved DNA-binding protein CbpA